jgi:hypothetical protein
MREVDSSGVTVAVMVVEAVAMEEVVEETDNEAGRVRVLVL